MPVIVRFSKHVYERLGEEVVKELVDWFNSVDTTYKADLRELNDRNYSRFEAKLEQRIAEVNARIDALGAELRAEMRAQKAEILGEMHGGMQALKAELIKWMFLFWAGTALAGLLIR